MIILDVQFLLIEAYNLTIKLFKAPMNSVFAFKHVKVLPNFYHSQKKRIDIINELREIFHCLR